MPVPTIQDYFGTNAQVTFDAGGDVVLMVYPKDFGAEGLALIIDPAQLKPGQIITAQIIKWLNFSVGRDDDPLVPVIVSSPRPGLITRGEVGQRQTSFDLAVYAADNSPVIPDPDLIV